MKPYLLCQLFIVFLTAVQAQDNFSINYLNKTGDYACMYNGQIEPIYNPRLYPSLPYYKNSDFTEGNIVFKKSNYPQQQVRLDLYKEQLIVLSPQGHYGIIVNQENVEKIQMYNKTFIRKDPLKNNGLKDAGYYILLFEGKHTQLLCKEKFIIAKREVIFQFSPQTRYYLLIDNQYHVVKNKKSISRLFPQYKKQINQFAKDKKLDFNDNKEHSLTLLIEYCEKLITSNNT